MPSERFRIVVLSTGRQDAGLLRSLMLALRLDDRFDVALWAGGMHLSDQFGATANTLVQSLGVPARLLPFLSDPVDVGADSGRAVSLVHARLVEDEPDAILLVGDRSETLAAAFAASLARVPIVHVHGGEETEGAFDNVFRHAITKLAHLHLVSHPLHAQRVRQMGEPEDRVVVIGAPGLDNLFRRDLPNRDELEASLGFTLIDPIVVATVHPATLSNDPLAEVQAVMAALEDAEGSVVVTAPNGDPGGVAIHEAWRPWVARHSRVHFVESLGGDRYWALLKLAALVIGNSSSGIIEAPAVGVPVVNVGDRQRGRLRGSGVVDVMADATAVRQAVREILAARAAGKPVATSSPFPAGLAGTRAAEAIATWAPVASPVKAFAMLSHSRGAN